MVHGVAFMLGRLKLGIPIPDVPPAVVLFCVKEDPVFLPNGVF